METPYVYDRDALALLLIKSHFPERTDAESAIIRDWLRARGDQYDRFAFSVRLGEGIAPNPDHEPGVQRGGNYSSKKRLDILAWRGPQPIIFEVKARITPAVLGQLQTYRMLYLEENPDSADPELAAIGRTSDPDTLRVLRAHGVTVFLYETPLDSE